MENWKHLLLTATMVAAATPTALGVPANPRPSEIRLPDGSTLTLKLEGDERNHFATTADGYVVEKGADGFFYYMGEDLLPTGIRATDVKHRLKPELDFISKIDRSSIRAAMSARPARIPRKTQDTHLLSTFPSQGEVRGAVILVEYSDVKFSVPDAHEEFTAMLNEPGYSNYGGTGSARDWFLDQSMGGFSPHFDVYGPVTLPHPRAYYGANSGGEDVRAHEMLIHACNILDEEVDFTRYDENDDGWIDNVFIFYAGYGENLGLGVPSECVWPHSWDLTEVTAIPYMYDGVRLNHYACTNEIDLNDRMDGIGTFVHEFSHVLGLPDLYSTNGSSAFTPGAWDVMDEGPYNNESRTPPNYSAYERHALGWLHPRELSQPANIRLDDISANTAAIVRTASDNEYFLLENRQQKGWDKYIPGHGMLVWHIDFNENVWKYNTVNDRKDHQYVDLEEADGMQSSINRDADCFPGTAGITEFTDDTMPSMRSWNGEGQNKPITDISEKDGRIHFKVCGGKNEVPAVEAYEATGVGIDSFTASWSEGNSGCSYVLSVYTTDISESGRPITDYVSGWESRNLGSRLSAMVTGLAPSTLYRYSVRAVDPETGRQSAASNEVTVTTLEATFDYLQPEITEVAESDSTFSLTWTPVDGAGEYLLSVYRKLPGEMAADDVDFTDGVSGMREGWESTSNLTYANAAYCGHAVPSLRFNADAQLLQSPVYSEPVSGVSFWARGVSASADARIEVFGKGRTEWQLIGVFEIENAAGGRQYCIEEDHTWPEGCNQIRIVFRNGGKGSLALDDVSVIYGACHGEEFIGGAENFWTGTGLSAEVSGLEPQKVYWARVRARSGDIFSRYSHERRLYYSTTGIDEATGDTRYSVSGLDITADATLRLYNLQGMPVAEGHGSVTAPTPGVYIMTIGGSCTKLMLK